jgi:hypothetical protein
MKPVVWHVIFHPREKHQWWARRYGHVSLVGFVNETWMHLDLNRSGFIAEAFFCRDEVQAFLSNALCYAHVLRVPSLQKTRSHFMRPMTCVSFTKQVLGLRSRALLPDQLFDTLTKNHGAEWLNEEAKSPQGNTGTSGTAREGAG